MDRKWTMGMTPLVVFILLIVAGLYDLYMVVFHGTGSSISNFMINVGFKAPFVVFVSGAVVSHLFFYMTVEKDGK